MDDHLLTGDDHVARPIFRGDPAVRQLADTPLHLEVEASPSIVSRRQSPAHRCIVLPRPLLRLTGHAPLVTDIVDLQLAARPGRHVRRLHDELLVELGRNPRRTEIHRDTGGDLLRLHRGQCSHIRLVAGIILSQGLGTAQLLADISGQVRHRGDPPVRVAVITVCGTGFLECGLGVLLCQIHQCGDLRRRQSLVARGGDGHGVFDGVGVGDLHDGVQRISEEPCTLLRFRGLFGVVLQAVDHAHERVITDDATQVLAHRVPVLDRRFGDIAQLLGHFLGQFAFIGAVPDGIVQTPGTFQLRELLLGLRRSRGAGGGIGVTVDVAVLLDVGVVVLVELAA